MTMQFSEARCLLCDISLLSHREWQETPPEHRPHGRMRRHGGRGLCTQCHKRESRLGNLYKYPSIAGYKNPWSGPQERAAKPQQRTQSHIPQTPFPQDVEMPCQDESVDSEWWFSYADDKTELAKSICRSGRDGAGCPAKELCLSGAIKRKEFWGVWGGEIVRHGEVVPYQRIDARDALTGDQLRNRKKRKKVA